MSNDDIAFARGGLRPSMQPYGTVKRSYYKLTTRADAIFIGQPMDLDTNGNAVVVAIGTDAGIYTIGPVLGFSRDSRGQMGLPDAMSLITQAAYLPGNTDAYVCIADDPNQEFIIQEASTGTQLTTANIGNVGGFFYNRVVSSVAGTTGSTVTGSSLAELYPPFVVVASNGLFRLVGLADNMNSDGTFNSVGAYAKWRVRINNHRFNAGLVGQAV
jgi:hypothetical protein